ncbi:MAG: bifunctional (p)ppGpp synthetase/guanosine-3',5'-bis(diphosphate) 3'-pyrophosphohydrolase [Spirochaetaceae bacterium]|nr:bifunctional (p)ppGpp synthetase/guanosine-3',5'-bis(diphosphate) 3'-pyrophosphohydrolase [Spirochaetaceae bacterium]
MRNQLEIFKTKLASLTEKEQTKIMDAAIWAKELHKDQKRASGEPYFIHPLRVAEILIDMEMDSDTIISALLHDVLEDTNVVFNEIKRRYGKEVANMVEGVTKISILKAKSKSIQEAETIRKMLLAMAKDIRVIIIKLADKLHNMGTLEYLPEKKRKSIASECLEIYAPLADRLGISWMKAELEDLSLKHLNPTTYKYIEDYIASKKSEQSKYLKKAELTILKTAAKDGLRISASTRAKHIYSIYRKMKSRKKDINEIYDLLGIRILCTSSNECYTLLGMVHKLWPPIEGRFKDYIAMPKANQYQSLHTSVMCYGGKITEIQIRTEDMHSTAENGVAAHWKYKGSAKRINSDLHPIVNRFKKWDGIKSGSGEFLENIRSEFLRDSIYVFTPNGHIIELPKKSTAIDFAFHIHTEIGTHTIGAKADGSIIPLNKELKNTQVIEIMTSNTARPHVNWLRFVATTRAKNKIRHWLNQHEDNLYIDKNIIAKKKKPIDVEKKEPGLKPSSSTDKKETIIKHVLDQALLTFRIGDEKNMMISIAGCCHPSTGDDIIGYISRGRGIIVHKKDCPNLKNITEIEDRCIDVEWEAVSPREIHRFKVLSKMTSDLFSEIEGAVRKYKGHLIEGRLEEDERGKLSGNFTMELDNKSDYKKIIKCIRTIPSVLNIQSL